MYMGAIYYIVGHYAIPPNSIYMGASCGFRNAVNFKTHNTLALKKGPAAGVTSD
jgi:hypothetical protein